MLFFDPCPLFSPGTSHCKYNGLTRYTEEAEAENDRVGGSGALWTNDLYVSIGQIASLGGHGGGGAGDEMGRLSQMQGGATPTSVF